MFRGRYEQVLVLLCDLLLATLRGIERIHFPGQKGKKI